MQAINENNDLEYAPEECNILAMVMNQYKYSKKRLLDDKCSFLSTFTLRQGEKKFGIKAKDAAYKEMKQIDKRMVFEPIRIESLTEEEKKRAMESLIFLSEKRDGTIKSRYCANGSTQRSYIPKEQAASPTAGTDSVLITSVIEAKQGRDVMTLDIPNAFPQASIPDENEKVIMKIRGRLIDMLLEIDFEKYSPFVYENEKERILYVVLKKALYGMLMASILYYKKFKKDIEGIGYKLNPYDMCVANKIVNEKQHTLTWHVDDIKASHLDSKVNDEFAAWAEQTYGSEELGHVKVHRGKRHDYLGMILDYSLAGKLQVDMKYYIDKMIEEYPYPITPASSPWNDNLFKINEESTPLDKRDSEIFHSTVMKGMFLVKRGRPDAETAFSFLSSRVNYSTEQDKKKLEKCMGYLLHSRDDILTLEADDKQNLYWYIDASFAVHPDMKSHTGAIFTLGKGSIISSSTKQKVNSRSTTEAELIAVDDKVSKIVWSKKFLEHQGFKVNLNIIYQDNTSTIKLMNNGKLSSGKRTRHFDIRLFYINDLIGRGECIVKYCPTEEMIADYMSKPLTGKAYQINKRQILNLH